MYSLKKVKTERDIDRKIDSKTVGKSVGEAEMKSDSDKRKHRDREKKE